MAWYSLYATEPIICKYMQLATALELNNSFLTVRLKKRFGNEAVHLLFFLK
uniref:Uncharacterized protein n=1 Tax=Arundo donax TaxID=35708 RepID=A0A0A9GST2_ARUDO